MRPIQELDAGSISRIKYILCDIDDTLTTGGKLTAKAYSALWKLHDFGYAVIPVTGRSAGWCDLIIREWPVQAVVGENGAFVFYAEGGKIRSFVHPSVAGSEVRAKLKEVQSACLKGVSGCRVAQDQFSRIYDLAIDFNENPPHLGLDAAQKIKDICVSFGAQAKISSIHVNAWFGDYDKLMMSRLFLEEVLQENNLLKTCMFFGDSPNDEPMFSFFPNSCAVANILQFSENMEHLPAFVTTRAGGEGFSEAVEHILCNMNSNLVSVRRE